MDSNRHDEKFVNTSGALINGYNEKVRLKLEYETVFKLCKLWCKSMDSQWRWPGNLPYLNLEFMQARLRLRVGYYPTSLVNSLEIWMWISCIAQTCITLSQMAHFIVRIWFPEKDKSTWKKKLWGGIILARQFNELGFDPKVIGLNDINLKMESIKENGLPWDKVETRWSRGKLLYHGWSYSSAKVQHSAWCGYCSGVSRM